jgi:YidC/Oxa1 family membrane protein insertase
MFAGPPLNQRLVIHYSNLETDTHEVMTDKMEVDDLLKLNFPNTRWAGFTTRYFLFAQIKDSLWERTPGEGQSEGSGEAFPTMTTDQTLSNYTGGPVVLGIDLTLGNLKETKTSFFFGPKKLNELQKISPTIDQSLDFGWLNFLAMLMLKLLQMFYNFLGNYGWAIVFLTLVVRMITFPLQYKSTKSMKDMQKIQPQIAAVKEKYKDNKEKLNQEMMKLMKNNSVNPLGGCFPLLIQMPIFFALYRVLYGAIELFHSPFHFWIEDLSTKDPYYVLPVLMGITMFIQQKLTPMQSADPNQKKIMTFMPIFFTFLMLQLPSGLNLYIFVSTLVGIFQQLWMNKKFGITPGGGAEAPKTVGAT